MALRVYWLAVPVAKLEVVDSIPTQNKSLYDEYDDLVCVWV